MGLIYHFPWKKVILPPDLTQKTFPLKLRPVTLAKNDFFVLPTIPETHKQKMVNCHLHQFKLSLPEICGQDWRIIYPAYSHSLWVFTIYSCKICRETSVFDQKIYRQSWYFEVKKSYLKFGSSNSNRNCWNQNFKIREQF